MAIKKKPLTLVQRLQQAKLKSDRALNVFVQAQEALHKETEELKVVVSEIDLQIDELESLRINAVTQVGVNQDKHMRITSIFG